MDVLIFVREMIHKFANLKEAILTKLLETFAAIKSLKIVRGSLWILGEYCESAEDIQSLITLVRQSLGDLPIVDDELKIASGANGDDASDELILRSNTNATSAVTGGQLVTADGTYASQSAFSLGATSGKKSDSSSKDGVDKRPTFRGFLLQGNFFIAAALARTLTKLALKYVRLESGSLKQNRFVAEAVFILASILHYGKSGMPKKPISEDDTDTIYACLKVLCDRAPFVVELFDEKSRQALNTMLEAKLFEESNSRENNKYAKMNGHAQVTTRGFGQNLVH